MAYTASLRSKLGSERSERSSRRKHSFIHAYFQNSTLDLIEYANGTGTILFAEQPSFFARSGFTSLSSGLSVPGFYKIKDAKNVMKLLEE